MDFSHRNVLLAIVGVGLARKRTSLSGTAIPRAPTPQSTAAYRKEDNCGLWRRIVGAIVVIVAIAFVVVGVLASFNKAEWPTAVGAILLILLSILVPLYKGGKDYWARIPLRDKGVGFHYSCDAALTNEFHSG